MWTCEKLSSSSAHGFLCFPKRQWRVGFTSARLVKMFFRLVMCLFYLFLIDSGRKSPWFCLVGFLVKNISSKLVLISKHTLWFTKQLQMKRSSLSVRKASEIKPSLFSFSIDKGILAFNLFSFYLGNLRWFLLTIGCSYWVQFSSEKRLWSGLLNLISIHSKSFWGKNTYNNFWTKKNRLWSCVALRSR